jgi:hypothetical protein
VRVEAVKANLVETMIKMVNTSEVVVEAMIKMETRLWKVVVEITMKMEIMLGVAVEVMMRMVTKWAEEAVKANPAGIMTKTVNILEVVVEAMIKTEIRLRKVVAEITMKTVNTSEVAEEAMTLTETKFKTMVAVAITVKATMALLKMESRLLIYSTTLWMVKMTTLLLMRRKLLVSKNF